MSSCLSCYSYAPIYIHNTYIHNIIDKLTGTYIVFIRQLISIDMTLLFITHNKMYILYLSKGLHTELEQHTKNT